MTLTSCVGTYNFCQVLETQPIDQKGLIREKNGAYQFENEYCTIDYYFWSDHGSAGFKMYNKTDKIIYVDLTKSFFVRNGVAYDLYKGREWSESASTSRMLSYQNHASYSSSTSASATEIVQPGIMTPIDIVATTSSSSVSKGTIAGKSNSSSTAYSHAYSVTYKESPIIAIPPHCYKYIETEYIIQNMVLSCDLQTYPKNSSTLSFTSDNTPLQFNNYISYSVGEDNSILFVNNSFYVSRITNYAEPEIVKYTKRKVYCENLKDIPQYTSKTDSGAELYDKKINDDVCEFATSFYYIYEKKSKKPLYKAKDKKAYVFNQKYGAYTIQGQGGQ